MFERLRKRKSETPTESELPPLPPSPIPSIKKVGGVEGLPERPPATSVEETSSGRKLPRWLVGVVALVMVLLLMIGGWWFLPSDGGNGGGGSVAVAPTDEGDATDEEQPPTDEEQPPSDEEQPPDGTAPDGTAPDGTAPDGTAPDGTAPDGTAPDESGLVATPMPGNEPAVWPTATPMPGNESVVEAAAGAGMVLLVDDAFEDNRTGWRLGSTHERDQTTIEGGVMRVVWNDAFSSYELYEGQWVNDFIAEVECLVVTGGSDASCGIIFTADREAGAYEYEVLPGLYRLGQYSTDGQSVNQLLSGDPGSAWNAGGTNQLRMEHVGGETRIYLNGQLLGSTPWVSIESGQVGISTNAYRDEGAEIWIDNFRLWSVQ